MVIMEQLRNVSGKDNLLGIHAFANLAFGKLTSSDKRLHKCINLSTAQTHTFLSRLNTFS